MHKAVVSIGGLLICASATAQEAAPKIEFHGDARYRFENIDAPGAPKRNRERIRARFGATGQVNTWIKGNFRLASGSGDPISTNQTLGEAESKKPVHIDLANIVAQPIEGLSFGLGKTENPYYRAGGSQLIFDSDLTPEGIYADYDLKFDMIGIGLTASRTWIEERAGQDEKDALLNGGQLAVSFDTDMFGLTAGASLFHFDNVKGQAPVVAESGFGNTIESDVYATGFRLLEYFVEARVGLPVMPLTVFYDAVENSEADENNKGWTAGLALGGKGAAIPLTVSALYKEVEADAVFGAFSDSDFANGGTNSKGYVYSASYEVVENTTVAVTNFVNKMDLDLEKGYYRTQVDLGVKF